jgi:hypothetical protein
MARLRDVRSPEAQAKASVKSANKSYGIDTKPSDLFMTRLKEG